MTRERWTLLAAILGASVTMLDQTVVLVALPAIERDLGVGLSGQQWIVNAYLLSLSALLLLGGALGDAFGRRRLFMIGGSLFGVTSLGAGLAPTAEYLLVARFLQGVAAAALVPTSLALVRSGFGAEERAGAIGSWAAWTGVGAAIGPFLGGLIIMFVSWRGVFFIGIPVAAIAVLVARKHVEESRKEAEHAQHVDPFGGLLATLAIGGLCFYLIQGPEAGWSRGSVLAAGAVGLLAIPVFLAWERRHRRPLLPLTLFRNRNFSAANAATLGLYGGLQAGFFLLMIQLQSVHGYSPVQAGLATLPTVLIMLALAGRFGRLGARIGPRWPMTGGQALAGAGLAYLVLLEPADSYAAGVLPGVVLIGLGLAIAVPALTDTAISSVPEDKAGLASGVNNAAARLAALLAVALVGTAFAISTPSAGYGLAMLLTVGFIALGTAIAAAGIKNNR